MFVFLMVPEAIDRACPGVYFFAVGLETYERIQSTGVSLGIISG